MRSSLLQDITELSGNALPKNILGFLDP